MMYEYLLLDEERFIRENSGQDIKELYKRIEVNANKVNLKVSKKTYGETGGGIFLETDDSVNEYRNRGCFFMAITLDMQVMEYLIKWRAIHNLERGGDSFDDEDVLASMKRFGLR